MATGWGQTTKDGALEDRLHQAVLRVQNNTDCGQVNISVWLLLSGLPVILQVYSLRYGVDITNEHLCAGPDPGTVTGTCVVSVQGIFRERTETISMITGRQWGTTAVQPQGEMSLVC